MKELSEGDLQRQRAGMRCKTTPSSQWIMSEWIRKYLDNVERPLGDLQPRQALSIRLQMKVPIGPLQLRVLFNIIHLDVYILTLSSSV